VIEGKCWTEIQILQVDNRASSMEFCSLWIPLHRKVAVKFDYKGYFGMKQSPRNIALYIGTLSSSDVPLCKETERMSLSFDNHGT